jgi:RNA polymerase sigma factor (sigma-70 family)
MTVVNDYAEEVMGVAKAIAIHILGGEGGTDYSSWADDIAQDTMVALLEEEPFDDRYHLFAMCQLNAKHRAINFKMKEERRREIEQEHGDKINSMLTEQSAELLAADPYEVMAYEEMRDRLDTLSPLLYSTTERHYIDGLSVAEIAEQDEVTEDVIYKRLQRAREFIRDADPETERLLEPAKDGIEQQRERFAARTRAVECRRIRLRFPDLETNEWGVLYGQAN